ncbi:uncharacterized protein LOC132705091 [Cylas formicarius]|uniref:uncharacterized protein LOC132705091 n=1 Tax=Cylas formicarius TaxID=197179 RepID=UPI00295847E0|nr:uncharacterized protein LOC132705091 [Cylas formicarius]
MGDAQKLENYRPMQLLSHQYKMLVWIIISRLTKKLDEYQPYEQAGFRKGYSTSDHIFINHEQDWQSLHQPNAKYYFNQNEYTKPVNIERGVKQSYSLSFKLFTLVLEDIFKKLDLSNNNVSELQEMLTELHTECSKVGLNRNLRKSKEIYTEENVTTIDNKKIERVTEYIYLKTSFLIEIPKREK